jgi:hypothetical protein
MYQQVHPEIRNNLLKGEKVLWSGQPDRTILVLKSSPIALFGIIFLAMPISMLVLVGGFVPGFFFCFIGLFILIGGAITFGPVIYAFLAAKVTFYAITNRRLITRGGVIGTDFKFTEFDKIQTVDVVVGFWDKGRGTGSVNATLPGVSYVSTGRSGHVRANMHVLAAIYRPYEVQKILNDAIKEYEDEKSGHFERRPSKRRTKRDEVDSIMFCRFCGSEIPQDSAFCAKCGKKL